MNRFFVLSVVVLSCFVSATVHAEPTLKALIIDGQNNHGMWPKTTMMMKQYLEETGLFSVDIERTQFTWQGDDLIKEYPLEGVETVALKKPKTDPDFKPNFADYDVVISNLGYNAAPWPEATKAAFEAYVHGGGGFVSVHAADNSFGDWPEYNQMIGLGGWGGRNEKSGPYVYIDEQGETIRDNSAGPGGHHGQRHEFEIVVREKDHPITRGMPASWMHTKDELYDKLRGPAENMTILATAFGAPNKGGLGRHEPMLIALTYGDGRIFHTTLGHDDVSMECVGFIVSLQRGCEWAATGEVTQDIPSEFPSAEESMKREFEGDLVGAGR